MNTKQTIASLAILASASSAFALIGPGRGPRPEVRNYCLSLYQDDDGQASVGDCDQSAANRLRKLPLSENGCAEGQASMRTTRVVIPSCPTFVQL